jgi:hypothetical protein
MTLEFTGTVGKAFVTPNADGATVFEINGAQFVVTNLQPLPDGVQYQISIDSTPITTEPPSHEIGPTSQG